MSLPDVSRFDADGAATFQALGARLRELGLSSESARPVTQICAALFDLLAEPMQLYHLRGRTDPVARAMRLFMYADALGEADALELLGAELLERLLGVGLVVREGDRGVTCPFRLGLVGALFVFGDDLGVGGDAVMGPKNTTWHLCRAVASDAALGRVLDVGCGAGTLALFLAEQAREVVATDVNPRALVLGRANAALNAIDNVEFRAGSLFEPVIGETFDRIVSQPPFIAKPEAAREETYLYGGRRGDEVALALLGGLGAHLTPGGRALVLVDWPRFDDEPLDARIRRALGDARLSALVVACPPQDLDTWCAGYVALQERELGTSFRRSALEFRAHCDRAGLRSFELAFSVIVRGAVEPGWTRRVDILPLSRTDVKSSNLDALVASSDLLASPDAALLAARVGAPAGASIAERDGRYLMRFAELLAPIELSSGSAMLIAATEGGRTVREVLDRMAPEPANPPALRQKLLSAVRAALAHGVLEAKP